MGGDNVCDVGLYVKKVGNREQVTIQMDAPVIRCEVPPPGKSKAEYCFISIVRVYFQGTNIASITICPPARSSCYFSPCFLFSYAHALALSHPRPDPHTLSKTDKHPCASTLVLAYACRSHQRLFAVVCNVVTIAMPHLYTPDSHARCCQGTGNSVLFRCEYQWRSSVSAFGG